MLLKHNIVLDLKRTLIPYLELSNTLKCQAQFWFNLKPCLYLYIFNFQKSLANKEHPLFAQHFYNMGHYLPNKLKLIFAEFSCEDTFSSWEKCCQMCVCIFTSLCQMECGLDNLKNKNMPSKVFSMSPFINFCWFHYTMQQKTKSKIHQTKQFVN